MRQYKFRAYDKKKKEWLLGYEMPNLGGFSLLGEMVLMGEWASVLNTYLFDRDGHTAEDLEVTQFTGLKDSKGVEIYEGDIIKSGEKKAEVKFEGAEYLGMALVDVKDDCYCNILFEDDIEVIGNIYDN